MPDSKPHKRLLQIVWTDEEGRQWVKAEDHRRLFEQLETAREALERISTYGSHYTPHTGIARDALDALNPASRLSE